PRIKNFQAEVSAQVRGGDVLALGFRAGAIPGFCEVLVHRLFKLPTVEIPSDEFSLAARFIFRFAKLFLRASKNDSMTTALLLSREPSLPSALDLFLFSKDFTRAVYTERRGLCLSWTMLILMSRKPRHFCSENQYSPGKSPGRVANLAEKAEVFET